MSWVLLLQLNILFLAPHHVTPTPLSDDGIKMYEFKELLLYLFTYLLRVYFGNVIDTTIIKDY